MVPVAARRLMVEPVRTDPFGLAGLIVPRDAVLCAMAWAVTMCLRISWSGTRDEALLLVLH